MKSVAMLVMTILLATPAQASDFSALGKPAFARGLLLSVDRREEVLCAQRWQRAGRTELDPLISEIQDRMGIEIGDADEAALAFDFIADEPGGEADAPADWPRDPRLNAARCDRIASAFATGGLAAATALLAPRPSGPIALPSTGFCLAQLEQGKIGKDQPELVENVRQLRSDIRKSALVPADRAVIERDYASYASTTPPIANWAAIRGTEMADIICFPTLSILSKQLRGAR